MAQRQYPRSPTPSDDNHEATHQQMGVTRGGASKSRQESVQEVDITSLLEKDFEDGDNRFTAFSHRRSSSITEQVPPPVTFHRTKEHVMAYMIPLPPPLGQNGRPVVVPQRYMLYLPPAPDLLKLPPSSGIKERKRDKFVRKWQTEVRKAKMYSGSKASLSGVYSATVRGAVYGLSLIQRSELTFLSRLPRKTLRELCFVHPAAEGMAGTRRFELVMEEFQRNDRIAKRDFWIGVAVLPFAQGVDFAIPVGGGFSEVTLAWIVVTWSAWRTASGMLQRLVFKKGDVEMRNLDGRGRMHHDDTANDYLNDGGVANAVHEARGKDKKSLWQRFKEEKPPVTTTFRPSTSLDELSQYIQAACHVRNPKTFPDVGKPGTEAEVFTSIGWVPEDRESEDREGDVAWQTRKTTEDLKAVVTKAVKTYDKFCKAYVKDPEKASRDEEKARMKNLAREGKERMKSLKKEEKEKMKHQKREEKERRKRAKGMERLPDD